MSRDELEGNMTFKNTINQLLDDAMNDVITPLDACKQLSIIRRQNVPKFIETARALFHERRSLDPDELILRKLGWVLLDLHTENQEHVERWARTAGKTVEEVKAICKEFAEFKARLLVGVPL